MKAGSIQFRPLQNSEDLHMHYAVGSFANYDKRSAAMKRLIVLYPEMNMEQ
jgi:hypothetical protein